MSREDRDRGIRGPEDPRDERDIRRATDPRDERDPRDPRISGDPRDEVDDTAKMIMPLAHDVKRGIPQFVKVMGALTIAGLIMVFLVAWQIGNLQEDVLNRACERTVTFRDDNRAMWVFALDLSTPETPEEVKRRDLFTKELDRRLPVLECQNGIAVPVHETN